MSQLIVPGVAFMIASSPSTFKVTRKVFGSWVGTFEGVATPAGLFLHTLFFLLVLWLTGKYLPMLLPRVSGYVTGSIEATCSCPSGYKFNTHAEAGHRCEPVTMAPAPN